MHPKIIEKQREIIELFNSKPKDGIKLMRSLLNDGENFEDNLAEFFITQKQNLDLEAVGDYLGTSGAENTKVLEAFTERLNFEGQGFAENLRTFLNTFKLPGEAQKIDRLVESFGKKYFQQNSDKVASQDAAYILAYQTIMLNTDLHNPSIKQHKKMTLDELRKNLRGCNNKKDFDAEFLKGIYHEIQNKPFALNFVKISPGYELNSSALNKDSTFKKVDLLLKSNANAQDTFPGIGKEIQATIHKPKSWLNHFTGYEGTITLKDNKTNASVSIQIYKPGLFSKWLLSEQPKVIIQPINQDGVTPKSTIDLAAKVAAAFEAPVNSTKATYEYEKSDLETAYQQSKSTLQTEKFRDYKATWHEKIVANRGANEINGPPAATPPKG